MQIARIISIPIEEGGGGVNRVVVVVGSAIISKGFTIILSIQI